MTEPTIPLFSLTDVQQGLVGEEFRDCVTRMGIFYLSDYGIPDEEHQRITDLTLDFFARATPEQKKALVTPMAALRRGYSGLGTESTAQSTNTGTYTDYAEAFSMGLSDNLFPSAEFEAAWTAYFDRLYDAAKAAARIVLDAPGTYDGGDVETLLDANPVLRVRDYPEVPADRVAEHQPQRLASHYDLSIVTLLWQTPCANGFVSLQAEVDGEMVDLPTVPGAILVQCGAIVPIVTQGAIPAPHHQVSAPGSDQLVGSQRTSSVFFLRPSDDFTFNVPQAREYGIDVSLDAETATFGQWCGANYTEMHTDPKVREASGI